MADQVDVAERLDPDHPDELAVLLPAPELDARGDLAIQLLRGHVRLVPAIGGDDAAIRLGGRIHDREDGLGLVVTARADGHRAATLPVF